MTFPRPLFAGLPRGQLHHRFCSLSVCRVSARIRSSNLCFATNLPMQHALRSQSDTVKHPVAMDLRPSKPHAFKVQFKRVERVEGREGHKRVTKVKQIARTCCSTSWMIFSYAICRKRYKAVCQYTCLPKVYVHKRPVTLSCERLLVIGFPGSWRQNAKQIPWPRMHCIRCHETWPSYANSPQDSISRLWCCAVRKIDKSWVVPSSSLSCISAHDTLSRDKCEHVWTKVVPESYYQVCRTHTQPKLWRESVVGSKREQAPRALECRA